VNWPGEELSVKRTIRLKGMNGAVKGQLWESSDLLRIGRLSIVPVPDSMWQRIDELSRRPSTSV